MWTVVVKNTFRLNFVQRQSRTHRGRHCQTRPAAWPNSWRKRSKTNNDFPGHPAFSCSAPPLCELHGQRSTPPRSFCAASPCCCAASPCCRTAASPTMNTACSSPFLRTSRRPGNSWELLSDKGYPAYMLTQDLGGGEIIYFAHMGTYASTDAARQAAEELQQKNTG